MLRDDPNRSHRDTVLAVRKSAQLAYATGDKAAVTAHIEGLDTAHEAYIKAKVTFSTSDTDASMVNLNGTWARLNRIIMLMDDVYGSRR